MNEWMVAGVTAFATSLVVGFVFVAVVPWVRLQRLRAQARKMIPRVGQLWRQEDDLLFIAASDNTGLKIMRVDAATGLVTEFSDTWTEWQERIRNRVVWYTGTQRTLV